MIERKDNCRHSIEEGTPLHWEWTCVDCRPIKLGDLWRAAPIGWHDLEVRNAKQLAIIAAVRRREGDAVSSLLVERELMKNDDHMITEKDLDEALIRGLCPHSLHCRVEAPRTRYSMDGTIPIHLQKKYRQILGEKEENEKSFGAFLMIEGTFGILREDQEEIRDEDWRWIGASWENYKEKVEDCLVKGVKLLVIWASRLATVNMLQDLLKAVGEGTGGRMSILIIPPPIRKNDIIPEGYPRLDNWISLSAIAPENVRIVIDSGRFVDTGTNMDVLGIVYGAGRDEYERMAFAIHEGKRWVFKKTSKRDKGCYDCGETGHLARACPNKEESNQKEFGTEEEKGKDMEERGRMERKGLTKNEESEKRRNVYKREEEGMGSDKRRSEYRRDERGNGKEGRRMDYGEQKRRNERNETNERKRRHCHSEDRTTEGRGGMLGDSGVTEDERRR